MPKGITSCPWEFPVAGNMRTQYTSSLDITSTATIFSATGSGVVREIHIAVQYDAVGLAASLHTTLDAYFDGSGSAAWSIPLGSLCGNEPAGALVTGAINNLRFNNQFVTVTKSIVAAGASTQAQGMVLRFPIPFTNGLTLKISQSTGTAIVWTNTTYQDVLPACWNRNLRPIFARTNESTAKRTSTTKTFQWTDTTHITGTTTAFDATFIGKSIEGNDTGGVLTDKPAYDICIIGVPDATHLITSALDAAGVILTATNNTAYRLFTPHTFVSRAAGTRGYLAMVIGALTNATDGMGDPTLEGNVRLWTAGRPATAIGQTAVDATHAWSGTEDFFGSAFYWDSFADIVPHELVGLTQGLDGATGVVGAYKIFPEGLRYTDGLLGNWTNLSIAANTQNNWTSLVYEET